MDEIVDMFKAILVGKRAKFEIPPPKKDQLQQAVAQTPLPLTRSIKVATSSAGSGDIYEHSSKPDYHNPIETIYVASGNLSYMRFATRDGDVGKQQIPYYALPIAVSLKPGTEYAKIQVWHNG